MLNNAALPCCWALILYWLATALGEARPQHTCPESKQRGILRGSFGFDLCAPQPRPTRTGHVGSVDVPHIHKRRLLYEILHRIQQSIVQHGTVSVLPCKMCTTASLLPRCILRHPVKVLRVYSCDVALLREVLHLPPKAHQGIDIITRFPSPDESLQNLHLPKMFHGTAGCRRPAGIGFEFELEEVQDKIVNAKSISYALEHGLIHEMRSERLGRFRNLAEAAQ